MDITNWTFFKIISVFSDLVTIAGVITAIRFAILRKDENVLAFRISQFIHYLFRTAIIIIILAVLYGLTNLIYFIFLLFLKGNVHDTNAYWENGKEFQHILAYFTSYSIGLSIAWIICSFIWTSSWNFAKEFINLFLPKNKILLRQAPVLEITNATYGSQQKQIDVTQTLRQMIANDKLTIKASNDIWGDPHFGAAKSLVINYRLGQKTRQTVILEGVTHTIPDE